MIEPGLLKTRQVTIELDEWSGPPLKVAFLSDIHIGGEHVPESRVKEIAMQVMLEKPDLILIGGDFVDGHDKFGDRSDEFNAALQAGMGHLSALSAPMGVYASIGNHDDWYNQAAIRTNLAKARVHVLENASKDLEGRLCVAGLADHWTGEPDPSAIEQCPDGLPVIAFMHSPDTFPILPTRTSLALAGHTHGGQINLPILGRRVTAIKLDRKYAYGLSKYRGIPVYVTSGIGTSMLPARFRAPPEIVILQLR